MITGLPHLGGGQHKSPDAGSAQLVVEWTAALGRAGM